MFNHKYVLVYLIAHILILKKNAINQYFYYISEMEYFLKSHDYSHPIVKEKVHQISLYFKNGKSVSTMCSKVQCCLIFKRDKMYIFLSEIISKNVF